MVKKEEVEKEEEEIRAEINKLSDDKRKKYYEIVKERIKDPDTYATLNYLFVAGLHHFYLGKHLRGSINLLIFLLGIILIFFKGIGILLILGISAVELPALFRSQIIVQDFNNKIMRETLHEIEPHLKFQNR